MNKLIPIIETRAVSKAFSNVKVLQEIDFSLLPGEVHALLGENGAGKSTLIKIIAGIYKPDNGKIFFQNNPVVLNTPRDALALGINTIHQELLVFPELSIAENIFQGHFPKTPLGLINWPEMRRGSRELLADLESYELDVNAKVSSLSVANRQRVEIAKALSQNSSVLIMDEPTAALAGGDVERLIGVIKKLRKNGVGIVYVSHRMPEIFALADRVTVLRDGSLIGTCDIDKVNEESLVTMMVGRSVDRLFPNSDRQPGKTVLELKNISYKSRIKDISFKLREGEILGLAGVVGSGRSEIAQTIFGITPATSGEIIFNSQRVKISHPKTARNLGIGYIPEDRGIQGLIRQLPIFQNVTMATLEKSFLSFVILIKNEISRTINAVTQLKIRTTGPKQLVRKLSGGNQQKVVVAKWLETNPKVLIMDEPTRGIDVGAKAEIHSLMRLLADKGLAILMISSELPEVIGMSDRILVMNSGRIVSEHSRKEVTPELIGAAMTKKNIRIGTEEVV